MTNPRFSLLRFCTSCFFTACFFTACFCTVFLSGCLNLKLSQDMVPDDSDWAMEGASESRQHAARAAIDPPLYEQWRYDAGAGVGPAGALIINDAVIVGTRKGMVHSMDIKTGKRLGRIKHDAPIEAGLAVGDGLLFLPMAGDKKSVMAYELDSGKKRWVLKGAPVEAGLLLVNGLLIAVDVDAVVHALDASTGEERWQTLLEERTTVVSSPLAIGDNLYVIEESGRIYVLDLESGAYRWEVDLGVPVYNTASTDGEHLFVPTTRGQLISVDAESGEVAWEFALDDETVRFSTPAYSTADHKIYISTSSGQVRSIDAANGELEWTTELDGAIISAPLITDHTIYVGTMRKNLHALDSKTGTEMWSHEVTGRIKSAVAAYGNSIVVMAETQQVLAFSPDEPVTEDDQEKESP